jgi:circadian clock protein KaiB
MTPSDSTYHLTLFVTGASERSARAVDDAKRCCDLRLAGQYRLSVVDLYELSTDVLGGQVLVAPALVRNSPPPVRKVVGDLSNADAVAAALELPVAGDGLRTFS